MSRRGILVRTERIGAREAWAAQRRLAAARRAGDLPDVVWLLEHPPVFTAGRWHGPGQSVGYVVADLRPGRRVRGFVEALVGAMADAAGIPGAAPGVDAMGLYVGGRKLGSVGIRVREGVTTHGLALNRDPDLDWFGMLTACGAPGVAATSILAEGGDPDRARVEAALTGSLAERLGLELEPAELEDLLAAAAA
jgi:lipoyl(octanoyl) transferase